VFARMLVSAAVRTATMRDGFMGEIHPP